MLKSQYLTQPLPITIRILIYRAVLFLFILFYAVFWRIWFHLAANVPVQVTFPLFPSELFLRPHYSGHRHRETSSLFFGGCIREHGHATGETETYGEHSLAWFYCRYFRRSAEISCLAERLNLVTDSLYFIHIMWHLDACFLELRLLGGSLSEREHVKHRGGGN